MLIRVGILTVSDRAARHETRDVSGPVIAEIAQQSLSCAIVATSVVPDERFVIEELLRRWADETEIDLILTTGGTGFSLRDITPEATRAVIEREAPGFAEAMRSASLLVTPHAMLSRAVAGIRGRTLIINLPGSPKAVRENLTTILPALPHAIELLQADASSQTYAFAGPEEHALPPANQAKESPVWANELDAFLSSQKKRHAASTEESNGND